MRSQYQIRMYDTFTPDFILICTFFILVIAEQWEHQVFRRETREGESNMDSLLSFLSVDSE